MFSVPRHLILQHSSSVYERLGQEVCRDWTFGYVAERCWRVLLEGPPAVESTFSLPEKNQSHRGQSSVDSAPERIGEQSNTGEQSMTASRIRSGSMQTGNRDRRAVHVYSKQAEYL